MMVSALQLHQARRQGTASPAGSLVSRALVAAPVGRSRRDPEAHWGGSNSNCDAERGFDMGHALTPVTRTFLPASQNWPRQCGLFHPIPVLVSLGTGLRATGSLRLLPVARFNSVRRTANTAGRYPALGFGKATRHD